MKYIDLSEVQQQELLKQANIATRIAKKNIEKDWLIYGESVPFDELIAEIRQLNARIRQLSYAK